MSDGHEVERKFLVETVPEDVRWESEDAIRQGYLALDGATEVRVRLRRGEATLTIKSGGGRIRVEEELAVDADRAERLWALTEGRRIEKTRRVLRADGHAFEVDEYEGALRGLVVAEVEFPDDDAAEAFRPPAWLGREVTDDPRYKNRALACDGRPPQEG